MSERMTRHPSTVADWNDDRRTARLHATRLGHQWQKFGRTRRFLAAVALGTVPLLLAGGQYWVHDVQPERERLALTQPQIHEVYDAQSPADHDTAVVDLVGLGNKDATDTARTLSSYDRIGRVWAVQYDNGGIDTKVISELIATRAADEGIDNIVLSGHSMGGVVALEVAQHIYQDTDANLIGVVLDCTPVDLHAVRAGSRDSGEDMLRWIGWLPGARESRTMRLLVETAARQSRFLDTKSDWYPHVDVDEFRDVIDEVLTEKVLSEDVASNGLIESQFKTIVASGAIDNLKSLAAETDDKPRPGIVFVRPRAGWKDPVVDVDYTQKILVEQSGGTDGALLVAKLDGTGHANPNQQPVAYNEAIVGRILPFLQPILDEVSVTSDAAGGRR
ncbi:alpha/beta fold hydrolase [Rhodococcus wratislaviensis]|uniref:alpha/beta fold hydrolase n=1 Tax=Rhodococcus wratislaviensis TaxID=44752 RepID=UPI003514FBF5